MMCPRLSKELSEVAYLQAAQPKRASWTPELVQILAKLWQREA